MKKLIVLLTTALLVTTLTACGSKDEDKKEETKQEEKEKENSNADSDDVTLKYEDLDSDTYVLEFNGLKSEIVLYHENDKVYAQTLLTEGPYSSFGVSSKEEAEELMGPLVEQYQGIDGLTHKLTLGEDSLTESLTLDYKVVDFDEIAGKAGMLYDENAKENGVGFKATEQSLLDLGFKKQ